MAYALRLPRIKLALQLWSRSTSQGMGSSGMPLRLSRRIGSANRNSQIAIRLQNTTTYPYRLVRSQTPAEDDVDWATSHPDTRLRSVAPTNVFSSFPSGEGRGEPVAAFGRVASFEKKSSCNFNSLGLARGWWSNAQSKVHE